MAKESAIEWTDSSWSPWRGCTKVSPGCAHCYAERRAKRVGEDFNTIIRSKTTFQDPLKWKDPRRIFVGHLSDFAHEDVPLRWIDEAWEIMRQADHHTYMILTKRPHELKQLLPDDWADGWSHVWIGVTVENQENDWRLVALEEIPAVVRFVSCEPLLGSVDVYSFSPALDWVIAGGESGIGFRPMLTAWATHLRDQCVDAGVPFFFKQWSGLHPKKDPRGMLLDGILWDQKP